MPLVSIRFLEEGDNRPSEVLPLDRGEILGAGLVELTDLLVEFVVHSFLAGATDTVFDIVAVVPLIPGKVVEADKQAFDPALGRLPTPQRVIVTLLDLAPLFGQETFKEILPANERLRLGSLLDFCFWKVIEGKEAAAPLGEVLEKGSLQFRVSSGLHQISRSLAMLSDHISLAPSAWHHRTWAVSSEALHRGHLSSSWCFHFMSVVPTPLLAEACFVIQHRRLGFNTGMPSEQACQSIVSLASKGKRLWRTQHIWVTGSMMRPYKVGRLGEVILDGPFHRVHHSLWMERWGDARKGRRLNRKTQYCFAKASI